MIPSKKPTPEMSAVDALMGPAEADAPPPADAEEAAEGEEPEAPQADPLQLVGQLRGTVDKLEQAIAALN